ncbi:MAG: rhodanese-like domain-containing protein [Geobacter sp.]|nr:rhodanese-like domain-containing protein [Geobacter sp.]
MKKFVFAMIVTVTMASVAFAATHRNVSSVEAKQLLQKNHNVFLLDCRTPDEFRQARLGGAVLIPINEIERRLGEVPKNKPILVYCAVGSRSNLVAGFLASKGYNEVYNMTDGIVGWYRNGFSIAR